MTAMPSASLSRVRGFTLLELSVVMIVIALILGAVMKGGELLTTANYQTVHSVFVKEWLASFEKFRKRTTFVPGSSLTDTSQRVGSRLGVTELCNTGGSTQLTDEFLSHEIVIPDGEGHGLEDEYQYNDEQGTPRRLRACFSTVDWTVPGLSAHTTVSKPHHVLRLTGVARGLAEQLDAEIDNRLNAQDGQVRAETLANTGSLSFSEWPVTASGELTLLISIEK